MDGRDRAPPRGRRQPAGLALDGRRKQRPGGLGIYRRLRGHHRLGLCRDRQHRPEPLSHRPGLGAIEERHEEIRIKGEAAVPFTARWTEWGPILSGPQDGRYLALRWSAHDAESTNLHFLEMETVRTTAAGVDLAHRAGFANENMLIADADGVIAWTILGKIPQRTGYAGRLPVSWAYGDRHWDGWLKPEDTPVIINPSEGLLWTANNRALGGEAYAKLGDSGYHDGPRAHPIRDDLRALVAS